MITWIGDGILPTVLDSGDSPVLAAGFEIHWGRSVIFTSHGQAIRSVGFSIFPLSTGVLEKLLSTA